MTAGAIRTDFILSAEIMVIALNEVADQPFWPRLIILVVVALVITAAVYGVVAADREDGRHRAEPRAAHVTIRAEGRPRPGRRDAQTAGGAVDHRHGRDALGRRPHPARSGPTTLGWHAPYGFVHHAEEFVHDAVEGVGGVLAWLVNTAASAVIGLVVGAVVVAIMHVLPFGAATSALDTDGRPEQLRRLLRDQPDRPVVGGHPCGRTALQRHRGGLGMHHRRTLGAQQDLRPVVAGRARRSRGRAARRRCTAPTPRTPARACCTRVPFRPW